MIFTLGTTVSNAQTVADSVIVPNVFTPNLDGVNDVFKPVFKLEGKIDFYSIEIYDRFGIQIMQSDKKNQVWDGRTTAGVMCPEGNYFYVINISTKYGNVSYKGFVQLLR